VKPEPGFQGKSLWPEMKGEKAEPRDVVTELARDSNNDRRRTLLKGDWKIIELGNEGGFQLFNLREDPGELNDLARKDKAKLGEMREALKARSATIKDICPKRTDGLKSKPKARPADRPRWAGSYGVTSNVTESGPPTSGAALATTDIWLHDSRTRSGAVTGFEQAGSSLTRA
jgi:hypothetical protein